MKNTQRDINAFRNVLGEKWYADGALDNKDIDPDPSGDIFRALFDLKEIQEIQDAFAEATGVASIITTTDGVPITDASNFCCLCKDVIRQTHKGLKNCFKSDAEIGRFNPDGPIIQPCLSGGLWDAGASITAGNIHIANWLIGQVRDKNTDTARMMDYAREIGADVEKFMAAFQDVTEMPLDQFKAVARALFLVANQMSERAFQNLQQAQVLGERDRLNQIINRSDMVVFHWKNETDWPVLYVSDNVNHLTGYPAAAFTSGEVLYSQVVHPDDLAQVEEEATRLTNDPAVTEILHAPYRIVHKSGSVKWVRDHTTLLRDENGVCYEAEGLVVDITEKHTNDLKRKEMEKQLERAAKMELIGTVAGGVAHDLNNILVAIVSYPDLLLQQIEPDHPMRDPLQTMQGAGLRAADMVQELLTLTRRGVVAKEIISLGQVIHNYKKSPEFRDLQGNHPRTAIDFQVDQGLLNLKASTTHITKCVMNLIQNAFESIPLDGDGRVTVRVSNTYVDTGIRGYDDVVEGEYVTLQVSDDGMGIAPEDQERVFEPFYSTKKMGRSGTGLGMAVVWNSVKDHNGYLTIESDVGKGATFSVYFPATREDPIPTGDTGAHGTVDGQGKHVLVVDDVELQRTVATALLSRLGYRVSAVASGEEAVAFVKSNPVDILVLDMIMDPGIDGLETYRRICEIRPGQKALIASGFSETNRVKEAQQLGAGPYIKKPYKLEQISAALQKELAS